MTHASLFSGIGGFDLAAEWAGWENAFHCEWNKFGQKVLKYYWPNAKSYGDITKTDFTVWRGQIDVLTGGFPCQPYSVAGKRLGKEDERHLWPEMLRAIREIQPRWVVGENVSGIISWNGGLVFEEVQADLEAEGYEVQAFILPAAGVGAPHRRDRVWFVAFKNTNKDGRGSDEWEEKSNFGQFRNIRAGDNERICSNDEQTRITTNANRNGQYRCDRKYEKHTSQGEEHALNDVKHANAMHSNSTSIERQYFGQKRQGKSNRPNCRNGADYFQNFPTQSPICGGNDGISRELDGITFPKWRNESIRAYGNAIVPQVALQIFKAINQYQEIINNK